MDELIKFQQLCKPLPKLVPSKKDLYELICETCQNGEMLNTSKAFAIYKKYAKGKGWVSRYIPDNPKANKFGYVDHLEEWNIWSWEMNFKNWILNSMGRLVITGYLKIMPAIDFSELKISELEVKNG